MLNRVGSILIMLRKTNFSRKINIIPKQRILSMEAQREEINKKLI